MKAPNKIRLAILRQAGYAPLCSTDYQVEQAWRDATKWLDKDALNDIVAQFRISGEPTGIPAPHSRPFETRSVARQMEDGSWVGWTVRYGGKNGDPGTIPWIEGAYDVTCEETMILTRIFTEGRKEQ